jgi:anti-anti-sigma factor
MSLLTLTTSQEQEAIRVALEGELDLSSALTFDEELRRIEDDSSLKTLILDLCDLKFMDSTGLRLILSAHSRARKTDRRLLIEHASVAVTRIFRLTGVLDRLDVVEDSATTTV